MIDRRFWRALKGSRLRRNLDGPGFRRDLDGRRHAGKGGGEDSDNFAPPLARRERTAGASRGEGQGGLLEQTANQRVLYPLYLPKGRI